MGKNYTKRCNRCGDPIRMEEMSGGMWRPFNTDNSPHTCSTGMPIPKPIEPREGVDYRIVPHTEQEQTADMLYECVRCHVKFTAMNFRGARLATGRSPSHCGEVAYWRANVELLHR